LDAGDGVEKLNFVVPVLALEVDFGRTEAFDGVKSNRRDGVGIFVDRGLCIFGGKV